MLGPQTIASGIGRGESGSSLLVGGRGGALRDRLAQPARADAVVWSWQHGQLAQNTAGELVDAARAAVEALTRIGVQPGMSIGLIAENRYEWVVYDLALILIGAVSVCFPPDEFKSVPLEQLAVDYDLRLLIASDEALNERASVSWVLRLDGGSDAPPTLRPAAETTAPVNRDTYTLAFSSGTSGSLRALEMSSAGAAETIDVFCRAWPVSTEDRVLVALPLSNYQQRLMVYAAVLRGFELIILAPTRLFWALGQLSPTVFIGPPALFEAIYKRFCAAPVAARVAMMAALKLLGLLLPWRRRAIAARIFRPLHRALGSRMRILITGSAACPVPVLRFFWDIELPLYEAYGLTEGGIVAGNRPDAHRIGSVGRPLTPDTVSLTDEGEIIFRPRLAQSHGYWPPRPSENRTFLSDHGIATGDLGRFDASGFLYIEGRLNDAIVTSAGRKLSPEPLERRLEQVGGVSRAVLLGRPGTSRVNAVIGLAPDLAVAARTITERSVRALVAQLNGELRGSIQIQSPLFTDEAFTADNGLLTRNLKLRRHAVSVRYASMLGSAAASPRK